MIFGTSILLLKESEDKKKLSLSLVKVLSATRDFAIVLKLSIFADLL